MEDYHMQWFLVGEWLFVGQSVINFDVMKLVFNGEVEGLCVDITNNGQEVHLNLLCGKGL